MRESDGCILSWFAALRKPVGLCCQCLCGLRRSDAEMRLHLLAVPFADLEDGLAGRHGPGDVLGGRRAGRHGDRGRGNLVFALVVHHGIGSGLHGGRGEAAVRGRIGPVLRLIVVPE